MKESMLICAWVLWWTSNVGSPLPVDSFKTIEACKQRQGEFRQEIERKFPSRNHLFGCLPDTTDPRERRAP